MKGERKTSQPSAPSVRAHYTSSQRAPASDPSAIYTLYVHDWGFITLSEEKQIQCRSSFVHRGTNDVKVPSKAQQRPEGPILCLTFTFQEERGS